MYKILRKLLHCNFKRNYSNGNALSEKYCVISKVLSSKKPTDEVVVKGWIKALRKQKQNIFVDITDGSCNSKLQILINPAAKPPNLTTGCSISVNGILSETPKGQLELVAQNVEVTGECVVMDGYPFAPRKSYPPEYIRRYLHFRPRTNKFASLLRIRHSVVKAIHDHFDGEGFFNIHTPMLTSNDCEGAGEMFSVQPENKTLIKEMVKKGQSPEEAYFNTKAFLTVSGQLQLEAASHGLSKVYTFGPTFRAENSKSRLHLSEFYMIEAEAAFISNIEEVMQIIENLIKSCTKTVLDKNNSDFARFKIDPEVDFNLNWFDKPFAVLTYDEAFEILEKNNSKLSAQVDRTEGLSKEHELFLVKHCGDVLTFVINWPKEIKPFYMKQCSNDPTKVPILILQLTSDEIYWFFFYLIR